MEKLDFPEIGGFFPFSRELEDVLWIMGAVGILCLHLCLVRLQAVLCEMNLQDPSSLSLAETLQNSVCPNLVVNMTSDSGILVLPSLGSIASLTLNCNGTAIQLETTIYVGALQEVKLQQCVLQEHAFPLMDVSGNVELQDCAVKDNRDSVFRVKGRVYVSGSVFARNQGSVFHTEQLGFTLTVENSLFEENSSSLGAILRMSITNLSVCSNTTVSFEGSTFRRNSGLIEGSFLHVDTFGLQSSTAEQRLIVSNCKFSDSSGSLCFLRLAFIEVAFVNSVIRNVTLPFYLELTNAAITLDTIRIESVKKALVARFIAGEVYLRRVEIDGASDGPALLLTHTAAAPPGLLAIQGLSMTNLTQTDITLFVSTLYVLGVPVSMQDVFVTNCYSFAALCGAFFFTQSWVDNCTVTDSTAHQGVLIGIVDGQGRASNLVQRDTTIQTTNSILIMRAVFTILNVTIYFDSFRMPNATNLMVFDLSEVHFSNLQLFGLRGDSQMVIKFIHSNVFLSSLVFSPLEAQGLFQLIQSNVALQDFRADTVTLGYFAMITLYSTMEISQISFKNANITQAFLLAQTHCTALLNQVFLEGGTCESLVVAFSSYICVSDVMLQGTQAAVLFSSYLGSRVEATALQVNLAALNLLRCENGSVQISSSKFTDIRVLKTFISLRYGTVELTEVEISGLLATEGFPLVVGSYDSKVKLAHSSLQGVLSSSPNLMQLSHSELEVTHSSVSLFNASFAFLSQSSFLLYESHFVDGGLTQLSRYTRITAGIISAVDSSGVVNMSTFHNISGIRGGVLAVEALSLSVELQVADSRFEDCSAVQVGGAISAVAASVSVSHSTFYGNSAETGGVLYFQCSSQTQCSGSLASSEFAWNSAVEGGVLKWTNVKPSLQALTSYNNSAEYGSFEASLPSQIGLFNSTSLEIFGQAGVRTTPVIIALLDSSNQIITTNITTVKLLSTQIRGATELPTIQGLANFSGIIVETTPGSSVQIQALCPTIQQTFPNSTYTFNFTFHTRLCIPGEITLPEGCFLCPKNTFSFTPSDSYCSDCPSYGSCPGGDVLILDPGHWRKSSFTTEVFLCLNPDACAGGENSTCTEGYTGDLCSSCSEGYFPESTVVCKQCEKLPVVLISSILVCFFAVGCFIYIHNEAVEKRPRLATMRILGDFLHSLLLLPLIAVNWRTAQSGLLWTSEMWVSFGLHSFPLDCWISSATPTPVWRALIATAFPLCFCSLLLVFRRSVLAVRAGMLLLWWMQPYIVKTLFALVACRRQLDDWALASNPQLVCWESQHNKYVFGLFIPGVLLYCVAYPFVFYLFLTKKPLFLQYTSRSFFTSGLRKERRLWEWQHCLHKEGLLAATALMLATDYIFQVLAVAGALYLQLTWFATRQIYVLKEHQRLSAVSQLLQLFFVALSYYFVARLQLRDYILTVLSSVMLTCSLIFILFCLVVMRVLRRWPVAHEPPMEQEPSVHSVNEDFLVPQSSQVSSPVSIDHISLEVPDNST